MTLRRGVRVIFVLLTVITLWLTLSPVTWPEENPDAATGGGLAIATCFGLIAFLPTWRGLLLGLGAFSFALAFVPRAADDPDPVLSSLVGLGIGILLSAVALWPLVLRMRRRMTDKPRLP